MVLDLLGEVYSKLQFEDRPLDSHLDLLNRAKILSWACRMDHAHCIWNAKSKYRQWMQQANGQDTGL
jgi:REP element-mobilizing transposase RayT